MAASPVQVDEALVTGGPADGLRADPPLEEGLGDDPGRLSASLRRWLAGAVP